MRYTDVIRLRKLAAEEVQQQAWPWTRDQHIGTWSGAGIGAIGGSLFGTSLANSFRDLPPAARLAMILTPAAAGGVLGGTLGYQLGTNYKTMERPTVQVDLIPDAPKWMQSYLPWHWFDRGENI